MLLIREVFHCRPGKVRPMVEKFVAMANLMEKHGFGRPRIMTDVSGELYWTVVTEFEVESLDEFMKMDMGPELNKEFETIMKDYHDLVENGRREIFKLEG